MCTLKLCANVIKTILLMYCKVSLGRHNRPGEHVCSSSSPQNSVRPHDELDKAKLLFSTGSLSLVYAVNKLYPNSIFALSWDLSLGRGMLHIRLYCSLPPLVPGLQKETVFWEFRPLTGFGGLFAFWFGFLKIL